MKVLQINAVYGVGSTGVIVRDIHELCLEKGIESYVAYSTSNMLPAEIKNGYKIGKNLDKKLHAVFCRINGEQAYFSRSATKKLIAYIKEIKPDIVHLHNLHSNFVHLNMLLDFLGKEDIATVITLHDCWFYTGGCFHYTSVGCEGWKNECGNCPKKKKDTPAYVFDKSSRILQDRKKYLGKIKNLTVVGVSEWITDEAKSTFLGKKRCMTVYNGVDTDFFAPVESDIRRELGIEDKFVVLAIANKWLLPVNTNTLKTVVEGLDNETVMVMIGCGEADRNKLPKNVIATDFIRDRERMKAFYSMADVFANCTREESFSLVNVEAQACGTPAVTYKNTGAQETVELSLSLAVESGNAEALLEAIMTVKHNRKSTYSQKCREWVCSRFDKNANYLKYVELYKSLGEL